MSLGKIDRVFVGADRVAANGDFANKIGTYSLAVNAKFHKVPFYVVAPLTTFDRTCPNGNKSIEQGSDEVSVKEVLAKLSGAPKQPELITSLSMLPPKSCNGIYSR